MTAKKPMADKAGTSRKPVRSSLTGKPMQLETETRHAGQDRLSPRDQEILRDVPPHWGNGR